MKQKFRITTVILLILIPGLMRVNPVSAHASLARSNPPASAILPESPPEIRLWFTEALEPEFSNIELLNENGDTLNIPPAQIDPDNPLEMFLIPGELPDGIYTIVWKVVSKTDGHLTKGTIPFAVGDVSVSFASSVDVASSPRTSALIRWLNLFSFALPTGGAGFWLLVWIPTAADSDVEKRMKHFLRAGWGLLGVTTLLILLLQVSIVTEKSIFEVAGSAELRLIFSTYFGHVWTARLILWLAMGLAMLAGDFFTGYRHRLWIVLLTGSGILLTQSLFSHSSSIEHSAAAIAADWLHLMVMSLWLGGLFKFINTLIGIRENDFLPELVAYFSNYARTGVIALIITGVYATWLQVGSLEALLHTAYGQALLVKLALFMPLLAIAGINLVYTQRGIRAGKSIWTHRLRRLVALEIALIIGMLAAVGVMTAISPARSTLAARKAIHETPTPFNVTQSQRGLTVNLVISSTWTGENTFDIHLSSASGEPITDASLIRLRFTHQNENSGESELNPVHTADGIYSVSGANLSFPGDWQIRTTIQRPNEFDTVMDFKPEVTNRPAPREIDTTIPIKHRVIASLMTGITLMMIGVVMLSDEHRARQRMIAVPLLAASGVLLIMSGFMASQMQNTESVAIASDYSPAPTAPIRVVSLRDSDYPLLIRADGIILEPDANGIWRPDNLEAAARDAYLDTANRLWVATDSGLYVREAETWRKINDLPSTRLTDTHGYLFASGSGAIARLESGMKEIDSSRLHSLDVPESDQPAGELVMLGNHTHVLQNGTDVFQTEDLGLGWKPLNAPDDVQNIITGRDGNLIISTSKGLLRWTVTGRSWEKIASLPDDYLIDEMQLFQDQLYALAGGRLYHNQGSAWQAVSLPDSENAYITTTAIQNMIRLWVLDSEGLRLWSSDDGVEWKLYSITMRE